MSSEKYGRLRMRYYRKHEKHFTDCVRRRSHYILRDLPADILKKCFASAADSLLTGQGRNGLWKKKDAERVTFDVLCALQKAGKLPDLKNGEKLPRELFPAVEKKRDFFSLCIKRLFYGRESAADKKARTALVNAIVSRQSASGDWEGTVVGTVDAMERLLLLGMNDRRPEMLKGTEFLLSRVQPVLPGLHTGSPYGFNAHHMITTPDRSGEFASALKLKPEWLPRHVCYGHLAVIQNAVALTLLLKLGRETDSRVQRALDNLFEIEKSFGGFCATDVKKTFMAKKKG